MANDSSSSGYLQPNPAPGPLEGQELQRFVQQVVVGLTGLAGPLVVPYWQTEPPDTPQDATCWVAVMIGRQPADTFPFVGQYPWRAALSGDQSDQSYYFQRHESLEIACSVYDLGSNGLADHYAALLRDNLAIPQNREILTLAGMGLKTVGDLVNVPSIFKTRWRYRVDFPFTINRQIDRIYPVLTLKAANGLLYFDNGLPPQPFTASTT